ncbi:hypothetical protein SLEP1_g26409 [Rubroshorea leprosula]|uniref:Uncharacterized protein n=1 Tax=Rubroshorea leprosula TaxID=152421 RepID=A0AAV5JM44_9ROSI|nr:hypothetical protein SLEP1_g26409 [Rubroshorea leprosula]
MSLNLIHPLDSNHLRYQVKFRLGNLLPLLLIPFQAPQDPTVRKHSISSLKSRFLFIFC